jgi:hypothetical protein
MRGRLTPRRLDALCPEESEGDIEPDTFADDVRCSEGRSSGELLTLRR